MSRSDRLPPRWPVRVHLAARVAACAVLGLVALTIRPLPAWQEPAAGTTPPATGSPDKPVDFRTQIWPILRTRCIECHGPQEQDGGLRLDSKQAATLGGHTTNPVLGPPEESELYKRITSSDSSYRMPRGKPPLSDAETGLFRRWLEEGADWPASLRTGSKTDYWWDRVDAWLAPANDLRNRVLPVFYGFAGFLVLVFLIERLKEMRRHGHRWSSGKAAGLFNAASRVRVVHYLVITLVFLVVGLWIHDRSLLTELTDERQSLRVQLQNLTQPAQVQDSGDEDSGPVPIRPQHPRRLRGEYYRGNDERNQELFNGGYYRTAKLTIDLTDAEKQPLNWGDDIGDGHLLVRCEIEKSPNTTPALFPRHMKSNTFLSTQVTGKPIPELADQPVPFETLEDGQRWEAWYPIEVSRDGRFSGMIYLIRGSVEEQRPRGSIHYGIQYELTIRDGKLAEVSEIWMGSLFNLPGKLAFPPEGQIPIAQWFDFLPIPEIVGDNTTDPGLLGIPEHIPDYQERLERGELEPDAAEQEPSDRDEP